MFLAITREVSRSIINCELTHLARTPIDVERARQQHAQYEAALKQLGVAVLSLPEAPDLPDSVFVEDTALVFDEFAVILRPGAESRRPETESIRHVLAPYRRLFEIEAPARVDGGDLLRVGKRVYMGITTRSDSNAAEQLQEILNPFGYALTVVPVTGCLHLKSAVTQVSDDTLLVNPAMRGHIKQALVHFGFPAEDLAGYVEGEEPPMGSLTLQLVMQEQDPPRCRSDSCCCRRSGPCSWRPPATGSCCTPRRAATTVCACPPAGTCSWPGSIFRPSRCCGPGGP